MGILEWWKYAVGLFTASAYVPLSKYKGMRIAVDVSIFENGLCSSDIDKLATTCTPQYVAVDLLQSMMELHRNLARDIVPVYVFDGMAPYIKQHTEHDRLTKRENAGKEYLDLRKLALKNDGAVFTVEQVERATAARMRMKKPSALDQAALLRWMLDEGIEVYRSVLEADQQMAKLEKDGIVDGIISEDGDMIANGAKRVFSKMSRKSNGDLQFKVYERDVFMSDANPYQSKLCKYPELVTDAAILMGNDYAPRIEGNGHCKVLGSWEKTRQWDEGKQKYVNVSTGRRLDNGMLDKLATADDKVKWIAKYGKNGSKPPTAEEVERYWSARKYMLHAPVLEYCKDTKLVKIVPLNKLPDEDEHSSWVDFFGSDFGLGDIVGDSAMLDRIYHCKILPLKRKPVEEYLGLPKSADGKRPAALFEELDFEVDPPSIQPKICLINWARARRMDVRVSDPRPVIENVVAQCRRVSKPVSSDRLKPIVGQHNAFKGVNMQQQNDEYDTWNRQYLSVVKTMQPITDSVVDGYLGKRACRPSIRKRVKKLFCGGHYNPKSITCRNVSSKEDGTKYKMFCCECLSSKKSVVHHLYAVFEDKPGGKYSRKLSSCSCKKGELFCSHLIGFLYVVSTLQRVDQSQDDFESNYKVSPDLIKAVPMLIENQVVPDRFNQQTAQRKRQRKT